MKRLLVAALERAGLPFMRRGWSYPIGNRLALWSSALDKRWQTGWWS